MSDIGGAWGLIGISSQAASGTSLIDARKYLFMECFPMKFNGLAWSDPIASIAENSVAVRLEKRSSGS